MNKKEYLARLEALLSGISEEERQAAMEYYTDYLEDAGPEGEAQAIEHLGSPEIVAAAILESMRNDGAEGNWTERGYEERTPDREVPDSRENIEKRERRKRGFFWIVLAVMGIIVFGIPILSTVVSVALALIAAVAAVGFGGVAVVFALGVAGIVLIIMGMIRIIVSPGMGAVLAGIGFLCMAAGGLLLPVIMWIARTVIPGILKSVSWAFHRMFGRGGQSA